MFQQRRRGQSLPWRAVLAATVVAAGCGSHNCHVVGASSGVRITGGEDQVTVRVCFGPECGATPLLGGNGFVYLPSLLVGKAAHLTATYTSPSRRVTNNVTVVPGKFLPNGSDCAPTVAVATIRFDAAGRVIG